MSSPRIAAWSICLLAVTCCCSSTSDLHVRSAAEGYQTVAIRDEDLRNENQLESIDCYYPTTQHGLSCDREGYFINSFEGTVWWDPGELPSWEWERVPASRALCCRAGVPSKWTQDNSTEESTPLGIISVGCHTSSNEGESMMQCESDGSSFVTGFLNSMSLVKSPNTYYPVDGVECCTPVMLMSSGDAWSIERCGCTIQSNDISCDSPSSGEFLWGFDNLGETGKLRHAIPLQPGMCCKLCVGTELHSLDDCKDLDMCSKNGVCVLGACQCMPGFSGPTCSDQTSPTNSKQPWYQSIWLMGILGCVFLIGGLGLIFLMTHHRDYGAERNEAPEAANRLLTPEGSVGSVDTCSSSTVVSLPMEDGMNDVPDDQGSIVEDCHRDISSSETRTNAIDIEAGDLNTSARRVQDYSAPGGSHDQPLLYGSAVSSHEYPDPESEELVNDNDNEDNYESERGDESLPGKSNAAAITHLSCSICFERPVQVALVPCGHSSLCRRCSRKLQQCPFCRKDIVRRQKLFMTG